jgi:bifunctional ADP-heptose synthase (sugar kinase/adenylyltransferase)
VIVGTDELAGLRGKVAMVDGGFDPIHHGHVGHFEAASRLGAPLLCNVSSDDWVGRKHPPLLTQRQRGQVIDAFRVVTYTHLSQTTTEEVLRLLAPRYYVKGSDWRDRLPDGEVAVCAAERVEIVFLDTVVDSSSALLSAYLERAR